MATMDAISFHKGRPANFLDVGGGASPEKVGNAFRIVLADPNVKIILVNIFAGINRCDWIAEGLVQAMRDQKIEVPIVVRLAGTNVELGRPILAQSGFPFIMADNLDDAATRVMATLGAAS
jgi:succinyl-CoA synthetase beta subunit